MRSLFTRSTVDKGCLLVVITLKMACRIQLLLVIKRHSVGSVVMRGKEMPNRSTVRICLYFGERGVLVAI